MLKHLGIAASTILLAAATLYAQSPPTSTVLAVTPAGDKPAKAQEAPVDVNLRAADFDRLADKGLLAMRDKAETLKVGGVAVMSYFAGDHIESWTSKMLVVGHMKDDPTDTKKGNNLLAIVYAKAAEMADTLKNSGSQVRPPMTGEFGWEGGVIVPVKGGYLIGAFSGGQSADDVAVSHAGLDRVISTAKELR